MDVGMIFVLVTIALVLLLFSWLRRRPGPGRYPEVVQFILYDVKLNQVLVETFTQWQKPRRFEANNWEMNKHKIGFLNESVKKLLNDTFTLIGQYNEVIKTARKNKTTDYKMLDLSKLKEMLEQCRKELEDWMMTTIGQKELPPRYPTLMGFFFGER